MDEQTKTIIRVSGEDMAWMLGQLEARLDELEAMTPEEYRAYEAERRERGRLALEQICYEVPKRRASVA